MLINNELLDSPLATLLLSFRSSVVPLLPSSKQLAVSSVRSPPCARAATAAVNVTI